jgi:outer membrane protein assembly factor BamB
MRKIIEQGKTLIWDNYTIRFSDEIVTLYELTDRLFMYVPSGYIKENIYCYNKQTGKKIWVTSLFGTHTSIKNGMVKLVLLAEISLLIEMMSYFQS